MKIFRDDYHLVNLPIINIVVYQVIEVATTLWQICSEELLEHMLVYWGSKQPFLDE